MSKKSLQDTWCVSTAFETKEMIHTSTSIYDVYTCQGTWYVVHEYSIRKKRIVAAMKDFVTAPRLQLRAELINTYSSSNRS